MSHEFPAFRFYGNQQAAVRHIKRGLLELFKTEEILERMGVPIFQRTVEVNEYTSIRVQITKNQKFIHITSNPPSLPEIVQLPEKEREEDVWRCPDVFLIRKIDRVVKGLNLGDERDGYLIGYDYNKKQWRVATYKDPLGGSAAPYAANLGWYHASRDTEGRYTQCDVVTWHGQASPNFASVSRTENYALATPPKCYLQSYFYFQGRKFNAPNRVAGVCILEDNDIKYFYVHVVILTVDNFLTSKDTFRCTDACYRKSYNNVMQETGSWQLMSTWNAIDLTGIYLTPNTAYDEFMAPRSADYVDKDGNAYFIREYVADVREIEGVEHAFALPGATVFVRYNLKTQAYDVLQCSVNQVPTGFSNENVVIPLTEFETPYSYNATHSVNFSNTDRPWIFYVWPGTQDLYYATIEISVVGTGSMYESAQLEAKENSGLIRQDTTQADTDITLRIYRNFEEIEVIQLRQDYSTGKCTIPYDGSSTSPGFSVVDYGSFYASTLYLWEYHPEIEKSKRYVTVLTSGSPSGGNTTMTLHDELERTEEICISVQLKGVQEHFTDGGDSLGWVPEGISWFGGKGFTEGEWLETYRAWSAIYFREVSYEVPGYSYEVTYPNQAASPYSVHAPFPFFAWGVPTINSKLGRTSIPPETQYGVYYSAGYVIGVYQLDSSNVLYGSGPGFDLLSRRADGENLVHWKPEAYAIHRPINGNSEKPYLYLRRKVYHNVPYAGQTYQGVWIAYPSVWRGIAENPGLVIEGCGPCNTIWTADQDPQNYNWYTDNTALYGQHIINQLGAGPNYSREMWWFWSKPLGHLRNPEDPEDTATYWNDTDEWVLYSNVLSSEDLNRLTGETGLNFFDMGVL